MRASVFGGPDHRADSTPGIPLSASTQRPLSSARVGRPVASTPARALSSALPSKVGRSSTGSSYRVTSSRPSTSTSGACSGRSRSISSIFLRLRDARKIRLTGEGLPLELGELGAALGGEVEEGVELALVEGRALGGALDLDEAAVAGADDVHVGVGADVLLVAEVEEGDAVDDADADGGDGAGERLAAGLTSFLPWAQATASARAT